MNLSMWIVSDIFGSLVKESHCTTGNMCIKSIRLYSSRHERNPEILYLGTENDFFNNGSTSIVCMNQNDYIILEDVDLIESVNIIQDAFYSYSNWDQLCRKLIADNGSLDDLLHLSTEMFPSPIIVVDAAQTFVAISMKNAEFQNSPEWKEAEERGSISETYLKNYNLAHPEVYTLRHVFAVDPQYFFVKGYCKHIFINGSRRASVILKVTGRDYSRGQLQIFDYYSDIIKDWITSSGENGSKFQVRSYFARALDGDLDAVSAMIRQTVLFGWDEKCLKVLFVIKQTSEDAQFDMRLVTNITNEAEGRYAMFHNDSLVILVNSDIIEHAAFNNNLNRMLKGRSLFGAASFAFTDMKLIKQAFLIANSSLEHNPVIPGVLYHSQNTSIRRIAKILNEQAAATLDHPVLQLLKSYDKDNNTDYYKTLFVYLKNERRQQATAEELFIHRNTLTQRLTKIQELWHLDLEKPEERFHILFSFYTREYTSEQIK